MYALTIWQPWATAIALGPKRVENRTWAPHSGLKPGDRLIIHAAARKPTINDCEGVMELWPELPAREELPLGAAVAIATYRGARHCDWVDPWASGPVCWGLDDINALPAPVPMRGRQGLWTLSVGQRWAIDRVLFEAI